MNIIDQTCAKLKVTQRELAKRLGVEETVVSRWKRIGMKNANRKLIQILVEIDECDEDYKYSDLAEEIKYIIEQRSAEPRETATGR